MDLVGDVFLAVPVYVPFERFEVPRSELANGRQFVQRRTRSASSSPT